MTPGNINRLYQKLAKNLSEAKSELVKLATVVQRLIAAENKGGAEAEFGLSDKEKEQLLKSIDDVVVDIQKKSDEISEEIHDVKEN